VVREDRAMSQFALRLAQAQDLLSQNRADAALGILQRLAPKAAADPDVNSLMATTLLRLGRLDQAAYYARRAAAAAPNDPGKLTNLAIVLVSISKEGEGPELLRRIVKDHPAYHEARAALMTLLLWDRRAAEVMELGREGLAIGWHSKVAVNYAAALVALCENDEAVKFLREAIARFPDEVHLAASMCLALNAMHGADPEEIARAHRAYGALLDRVKPEFRATYAPAKDPDKKLRVALISPDLRQHSVAYFIEPWLEQFDRERFEVVCYSTNRNFDAFSKRFKSYASAWRDASSMIELQLAAKLSEDRIDIAIDLAGHQEGNSLKAFALRMAPVQITYLGYPDTTGVTQMDCRIVDSLTDPPDPALDARHTERLLRIDPCFLCYRPPADAPDVGCRMSSVGTGTTNLPAPTSDIRLPTSPVTFGSFNAGRKLSGPLLETWARILKAVPNSRLLLKAQGFADPAVPKRLYARLGDHGIDQDRVEILMPPKGVAEHLSLYGRVDIGLDPFPYNGTTTTCEALWMGVPVITLAGNRHAGRVGVSVLTNVGLSELIAPTMERYLEIAVGLASDRPRLLEYHRTLRARMAASPLCNAKGFARRFESALRDAWRGWCREPSP
jgi:predicted O-linked N-acetylglucosamine transferase (SPINDLY family)